MVGKKVQWENGVTVSCLCRPGEGIQSSAKESNWMGTEETKNDRKTHDCSHVSVSGIEINGETVAGTSEAFDIRVGVRQG